MSYIEISIAICVLIFLFYKWSIATYKIFEERNVPHEKPWPFLFGNTAEVVTGRKSNFQYITELNQKFKDKIFGFYSLRDAVFVIRDPELLKKIAIKDFDHFVNHRSIFTPEDDPLFGNMLNALHDQKWKDMRNTLSPAFTGNKMRLMFQLVTECCSEGVNYLKDEFENNPVKYSTGMDIEMKDYFTRFTNDIIASTAFGLKVNSFRDRKNEFYTIGRKVTNFQGLMILKIILMTISKRLFKLLKMNFINPNHKRYFMNLVIGAMKYRTDNGIIRPDMINLLMEARKFGHIEDDRNSEGKAQHNRSWNDEEIVAQCFLFFFAGFEITATALSFTAHELMRNQDIQDKLIAEIDKVRENLNGKPLTYEAINSMKYMEMVVSETLRKWPPSMMTDRVCSKPYTLEDEEKTVSVQLMKDDLIFIPIAGYHYDPENFPNPKKYDPERFNDENKLTIKPFSYLPFGIGPRNCIASRFALMEVKAILFYILSDFKFDISAKTKVDIEKDLRFIQMTPKNGFWLKFVQRKKE